MRLQDVGEFLCVDLEATCWPDGEEERRSETIQIGAVRYRVGFGVLGTFETFVRPVKHRELSAFCTKLTGITQDDVAGAASFPEAFTALRGFIGTGEPVFCSWSDFDREQLFKDCALHRMDYPFPIHVDLMKLFGQRTGRGSMSLQLAVGSCALQFIGRPHSAIDDARNLAAILDWLVQRETSSIDGDDKRQRFFEVAHQLVRATDDDEVRRLKEELARLTFDDR